MGYGLPKIQNSEIKKQILAVVEDALNKQADIFQGSQAYYGYAAKVEINLHLVARGETNLKIMTGAVDGDKPEEEKGGKLPPPVEINKTTSSAIKEGKQEVAKTGA